MHPAIIDCSSVPPEHAILIERLCRAAVTLANVLASDTGGKAHLVGQANGGGDEQKVIDAEADALFLSAAQSAGVRHYVSEEQETGLTLDETGRFALAIDPLDGSSNVGINMTVGSIFALFPAGETLEASFLRPGHEIVAAGYFIYGPQLGFVVTFGDGVRAYVYDHERDAFAALPQPMRVAPRTSEFAVNASNYPHWPRAVQIFVDDLTAGAEGPLGQTFNMRWVASMVADAHRILTRGGLYIYPADRRKGYESGRLRLLYECFPIGFLIEQAGGQATDGVDPILAKRATSFHERSGFAFGSAQLAARLTAYHDLGDTRRSALFSRRGLFRST